ncbi:MAG: GntR family transcriptional regulator [Solobacterium sp.]|nr:GntR family transcriptional regulator [Solobacterium sp.]
MSNTMRQHVYEEIKKRINDEIYKPGAHLSEQKICDDLAVSRSPVREALRQLEADGLVIATANKGVVVRHFSKKEIHDFYEVEKSIQAFSLNRIEKPLNTKQKKLFEALEQEFIEAYTALDLDSYLKLSDRFHYEIVKLCNNQFVEDIYKRIGVLNHRFRKLSLQNEKDFSRSHKEHLSIIHALVNNELEEANALLQIHFTKASKAVLIQLDGIKNMHI